VFPEVVTVGYDESLESSPTRKGHTPVSEG
jgi:hypothetical protein